MNTEHLNQWIGWMRETTLPQAQRGLAKFIDEEGVVGYCCLGLGSLKAGVSVNPVPWSRDCEHPECYEGDAAAYFGEGGCTGLAPAEFLLWLGIELEDQSGEFDIGIDWTDGLHTQGDEDGMGGGQAYLEAGWSGHIATAAGLNDAGFTFKQIADVVAYFGILDIA